MHYKNTGHLLHCALSFSGAEPGCHEIYDGDLFDLYADFGWGKAPSWMQRAGVAKAANVMVCIPDSSKDSKEAIKTITVMFMHGVFIYASALERQRISYKDTLEQLLGVRVEQSAINTIKARDMGLEQIIQYLHRSSACSAPCVVMRDENDNVKGVSY